MPAAKKAAQKALQLDETLAEAHVSLAFPLFNYDWDWAGAEKQFANAFKLNPKYPIAYLWHAHYLSVMGRFDEAIASATHGLELDPLSLILNADLGWHLYFSERYDDATLQLRKTLEMEPTFVYAYLRLGQCYEQKAMYKEAIAALEQGVSLSGNSPRYVAALAHVHAVAGMKAEANVLLDSLQSMASQRYVTPYHMAVVYAGLDETDRSLEWLDKTFQERSERLIYLNADPRWKKLRSHPAFQKLVRSVGLPS